MDKTLARKRSADIIRAERLPARPAVPALTAVERIIIVTPTRRGWRPDLWPWYVWAPPILAAGAILAYVLIGLAGFIAHTL